MKKLDNLLERDFHITEKRKIIFIIPAVIVLIAAIMMIIYNFTLGSPLNLGTDFTGGYSIDVKLGSKLTQSNYDEYCSRIEDVLSTVTAENGKQYSIRISNTQMQGSGDSSTIHIKYSSVKGATETEMIEDVNPAIKKELEEDILMMIPELSISDNQVTLTYSDVLVNASVDELFDTLKSFVANNDSFSFDSTNSNNFKLNDNNTKQIIITFNNFDSSKSTEFINAMKLNDKYAGSVTQGDMIGATVSTELIFTTVLAVSLALMFMLSYIGLRFQISSGLASIIALMHDLIIVFAFMAICRIEINSTFMAAIITVLGYSINNSIIIFDRVRENGNLLSGKNVSSEELANKSIKETLLRSINTTVTTLIMIAMVAIIGVSDIRIFAFPIIIGLLAGTYSSIFIAPSLWALFQRVGKKKANKAIAQKN